MNYALRLTGEQHHTLHSHLFPGDGKEAVALLLCGRRNGRERHIFTVQALTLIPHNACSVRAPDLITWPTRFVDQLLDRAHGREKAIIKIHSHAEGYRFFSGTDDRSDRELVSSIASLLDDGLPHASSIMLPRGEMFGRVLACEGQAAAPLSSIAVVGTDINIWEHAPLTALKPFAQRHAQAFGSGTISLLSRLSAAVVGCSGTGSLVIEQLARLGIGKLVLIDPDTVEEKNLNRIVNATRADIGKAKVEVLAAAIRNMGFGTKVVPLQSNLSSRAAILAVAECDVAFGCVDGIEGRHLLNRVSTFYTLPYFDVGVRLDADGHGGIDEIAGAVHYLQPGRSSLLSRGVYTLKQLEAEGMKRTNRDLYEAQRREDYLRGVNEERPAVISVNMLFSSLCVNEFLARLHPYRNQSNSEFACVRGNLCEASLLPESEEAPCKNIRPHVGRGDCTPLLDMPALS